MSRRPRLPPFPAFSSTRTKSECPRKVSQAFPSGVKESPYCSVLTVRPSIVEYQLAPRSRRKFGSVPAVEHGQHPLSSPDLLRPWKSGQSPWAAIGVHDSPQPAYANRLWLRFRLGLSVERPAMLLTSCCFSFQRPLLRRFQHWSHRRLKQIP